MGLGKGGLSGAAACWEDIHPGFFTKVENESTSLSLETGLLLKLRGQLRRFASGFRAILPPPPTRSHANGSLSLCFLSSRTQPPPLSQTETVTPGRVSQ